MDSNRWRPSLSVNAQAKHKTARDPIVEQSVILGVFCGEGG